MAEITVLRATDDGQDVLHVYGERDGEPLEARGWMSATRQHYDADAYGADGHRRPDAEARAMTREEALEYARRLLAEQNPLPVSQAAPVDLGLSG